MFQQLEVARQEEAKVPKETLKPMPNMFDQLGKMNV